MIGIPTSFTASIVEQVVTGLFGETTLTLRNLKVHEVQGVLRPAKPVLRFSRERIDLALPVRLAEGRGDAVLRFKWDSKGVAANVVCGDVDVTREVKGGVVPEDYRGSGHFGIASACPDIILTPRFPDLAVRVYVDPSEQA